MGKGCCIMLLIALVVVCTTGREVPKDKGLKDEKNFLNYGGVGGFSGIGNNGMPFAGIGSGIGGAGSLLPGGSGIFGTGGGFPVGGNTGPLGGFGGGGLGAGTGGAGGAGSLPLP